MNQKKWKRKWSPPSQSDIAFQTAQSNQGRTHFRRGRKIDETHYGRTDGLFHRHRRRRPHHQLKRRLLIWKWALGWLFALQGWCLIGVGVSYLKSIVIYWNWTCDSITPKWNKSRRRRRRNFFNELVLFFEACLLPLLLPPEFGKIHTFTDRR